jgi:putative SOS response-associated peptidase YedK
MCGRTPLSTDYSEIKIALKLGDDAPAPNTEPDWNTGPTKDQLVVYLDGETRQRACEKMRWGLIPRWAREPWAEFPTHNAKVETLTEKPMWRGPWGDGLRCLIVTDGFFEWDKRKKRKQPYAIARAKRQLTVMAGLWDTWRSRTGEIFKSCTVITTTANELIEPLHDRMPVIVPEKDWRKWLGEEPATEAELLALLKPYPAADMELWPVSRRVGDIKNNGPDLVVPVEEEITELF